MMKVCELNSIGDLIEIELGIRHKRKSIGSLGINSSNFRSLRTKIKNINKRVNVRVIQNQ